MIQFTQMPWKLNLSISSSEKKSIQLYQERLLMSSFKAISQEPLRLFLRRCMLSCVIKMLSESNLFRMNALLVSLITLEGKQLRE
jgi:hypothetical protein